jgi:hypothetical protein
MRNLASIPSNKLTQKRYKRTRRFLGKFRVGKQEGTKRERNRVGTCRGENLKGRKGENEVLRSI